MNARENFSFAGSCVDHCDGPTLWMPTLPLGRRELPEGRRDATVKQIRRALDPIVCTATRDAREPFLGRQIKEDGEIGCESFGRDPIGGHELLLRYATPRALIRVRRQEESVDEHDILRLDRWSQYPFDQLRARRHE